MEPSKNIINWDNVFKQSQSFKNNEPFMFGFVEEFIQQEFYEKLFETYPKLDDMWNELNTIVKYQFNREWNPKKPSEIVSDEEDPTLSRYWNEFKQYVQSEEFIENFRKFSGVPVTKLKALRFIDYRRGGFTVPHAHNLGPSTLILMIYFSKNWKKGDPGGTFMATDSNEESIIFEPYNLDNTMAIFHDGKNAFHGTRYITKDVERHALQLTLEEYSSESGWSAGTQDEQTEQKREELREIE